MISSILLLVLALVVPLVVRGRWMVAALSVAGSLLAGAIGWEEGLREDVPPVMLIFGYGGLTAAVLVVAVMVHAGKMAFLRRQGRT